jgi:Family of unknown function (DUF5946)
MNADPASESSEQDAYDELQSYTLSLGDPAFIHQHVVDAWAAQHADEKTKPIGLTFALVGLYLHVEKGFSGKQVQRAHMALARHKRAWPSFALPPERGSITANIVMAKEAGPARDEAIDDWSKSVWEAFRDSREAVVALLEESNTIQSL